MLKVIQIKQTIFLVMTIFFSTKTDIVDFSDFTIEGSRYFDKGFPSRALAIHLTYIDAYGNIRVKHFVSDSNDSAKDQALKFLEAGDKMKKWIMRHHHQLLITSGMIELLALYQQQKFPGLGVLKKMVPNASFGTYQSTTGSSKKLA